MAKIISDNYVIPRGAPQPSETIAGEVRVGIDEAMFEKVPRKYTGRSVSILSVKPRGTTISGKIGKTFAENKIPFNVLVSRDGSIVLIKTGTDGFVLDKSHKVGIKNLCQMLEERNVTLPANYLIQQERTASGALVAKLIKE